MSTDFYLRCTDCDEQMSLDNIRNPEWLLELWGKREQIGALNDFLSHFDMQLERFGSTICVGFFEQHKDHHVTVFDEYGREWDECGTWVKCEACGHDHHCKMKRGHDGPCRAPTKGTS